MFSDNDAEKARKLLEKLDRNENLGPVWRSQLNWLLENGFISEAQLKEYTTRHQNSIRAANQELAAIQAQQIAASRPEPCSACGNVINAGTYGYIYNSKNSPYNVIKGSILGHSRTTGCPPDFLRETDMYSKIFPIYKEIEPSILIRLLEVKDIFVENRKCYYEMNKIFPYVIDETLRQKIQSQISLLNKNNLKNDEYFLQTFLSNNTLIMLTPGISDNDYGGTGGNEHSSWLELGENKTKMLFSLLGISYDDYCNSLKLLLQSTLRNKIILTDVEFILGSVNTGKGLRNGIFMIDFDKVQETTAPVTQPEINTLLYQDMFPDVVRNTFYQKKYLKYKKKYENLKNKINLN